MKTYIQYFVFVGLIVFGCKKDEISVETPECLKTIIDDIKSQGKWNPPAKIFQYTYNRKIVYFIPQHCCDIPSQLMDAQCNIICAPDGGFSFCFLWKLPLIVCFTDPVFQNAAHSGQRFCV
ncbi:DUF6970 domain-containing protein [Spirosoma sp.]|uniref:DUF6970 domain-containing protein n=1 Tax=Spirosoma sp. TaxID=1899569 RepID=UPI003B3A8688